MMHQIRFQRVVAIACAAVLTLVTAAAVLLGGGAASAQPVLDVSKPDGKVLLGDQASVTITVTNSGDQRGYNLSLSDTFSSLPAGKTITFVSASTPDGPVTPTSVSTDPMTNELTVTFDDIRDLGPGESTTITIVVPTRTTRRGRSATCSTTR